MINLQAIKEQYKKNPNLRGKHCQTCCFYLKEQQNDQQWWICTSEETEDITTLFADKFPDFGFTANYCPIYKEKI